VAGTVDLGSTQLCSGIVCGPGVSGESGREIYLPVIHAD
jgi:hypothetical protein